MGAEFIIEVRALQPLPLHTMYIYTPHTYQLSKAHKRLGWIKYCEDFRPSCQNNDALIVMCKG